MSEKPAQPPRPSSEAGASGVVEPQFFADERKLRPVRYRAQTSDGRIAEGTIDAVDSEDATARLRRMGLTVTELGEAAPQTRGRALRRDEFLAFNEQLAQLTRAGMPVERGLRLIAQDMRGGKLARTIQSVADQLERGRSLPEAFEAHRGQFPRMYGRLMEAGIRSGNLPAMLLNLGRHLELVARLRNALWRAVAYPLILVVALSLVIVFLGYFVMPSFESIFNEFNIQLPGITSVVLALSRWLPIAAIVFILIALLTPVLWLALRNSGAGLKMGDMVGGVPLIGSVIRRNQVSRWVDALQVGVRAGLDLPGAIEVAGDAVGSPRLSRAGRQLADALAAGRSLDAAPRGAIPATVIAAIELAPRHGDLPAVLADMSRMYQQQAELRLGFVETVLTPVMLFLIMFIVGFVVAAVFVPMMKLMEGVMQV